MTLEVHDTDLANSLTGRYKNIDHDYQAEQHVQDESREPIFGPLDAIKFVLLDDEGVRCVWERTAEEAVQRKLPRVTKQEARYTGEWRIPN